VLKVNALQTAMEGVNCPQVRYLIALTSDYSPPSSFGRRDAFRSQTLQCPQRDDKYKRHILRALKKNTIWHLKVSMAPRCARMRNVKCGSKSIKSQECVGQMKRFYWLSLATHSLTSLVETHHKPEIA
jgi:hypothetical protein